MVLYNRLVEKFDNDLNFPTSQPISEENRNMASREEQLKARYELDDAVRQIFLDNPAISIAEAAKLLSKTLYTVQASMRRSHISRPLGRRYPKTPATEKAENDINA
jgi:hypothetical protein